MRGAHWGAHPCPTVGYKPLGQHPRVPRCKVPPALGTSGGVPGFAWNGVGLTFGYHGDRVTLGMMRNMDPTGDNMGDPGGLLCAPLTPCSSLQLTVYLGKRDFVDHIDVVDPVGMWWQEGDLSCRETHARVGWAVWEEGFWGAENC